MAKDKFSVSQLMSDASRAERQPVTQERREINITLSEIDASPMNRYSMEGIEELAASIEMVGLLQNPLVRQKANGRYEIIAGHRRIAAIRMLAQDNAEKYSTVRCSIIRNENDALDELRLLFANSTIRNFSDADKVYQAKRLRELLIDLKKAGYKFGGRMRDVMAGMLETSPTNVARYDSVDKYLIAEWRAIFDAKGIGITLAHELSRFHAERQLAVYAFWQTWKGDDDKQLLADYEASLLPVEPEPEPMAEPEQVAEPIAAPPASLADVPDMQQAQPPPHAAPTATPAAHREPPAPSPVIADGMKDGMQSAAKIEAGRNAGPIEVHVVTYNFMRMKPGDTITFVEFGTEQRKIFKIGEVQ